MGKIKSQRFNLIMMHIYYQYNDKNALDISQQEGKIASNCQPVLPYSTQFPLKNMWRSLNSNGYGFSMMIKTIAVAILFSALLYGCGGAVKSDDQAQQGPAEDWHTSVPPYARL